jgi:hypothetical protein
MSLLTHLSLVTQVVNARALRLRQEIVRDLPLLPMPPSSPCSASGIYSKAQMHIDDVDTRLVLAMAARKPASTPNPKH